VLTKRRSKLKISRRIQIWNQNGAFLFENTKMAYCHFENIYLNYEQSIIVSCQFSYYVIRFWEIRKFLTDGLRELACTRIILTFYHGDQDKKLNKNNIIGNFVL
jgi:hypothetical protein